MPLLCPSDCSELSNIWHNGTENATWPEIPRSLKIHKDILMEGLCHVAASSRECYVASLTFGRQTDK